MQLYVGLDVSQRKTAVCVINGEGQRVWQGVSKSTPQGIAYLIRTKASNAVRIGMETGLLSVWLWHQLRGLGFPVVCLHARHTAAALSMQVNKTDTNDAFGLAQIVRSGWYRQVEVKSLDSHRIRLLLRARSQLVVVRTRLYNQIRGLLKTFGVVLGPGKGATFEDLVRKSMPEENDVRLVIDSLLRTWKSVSDELLDLNRRISQIAEGSEVCRRLMTVPGVGPVTSLAFVTAIDNPHRFVRSRDVGAYLGLTPRRYQSGEVDRAGHISKCGDRMVRSLLFEAANVILTRLRRSCDLRTWGLHLAKRAGGPKAKVAVARKLAVILHKLWVEGSTFHWTGTPQAGMAA